MSTAPQRLCTPAPLINRNGARGEPTTLLEPSPTVAPPSASLRPSVGGKFLVIGKEKLYVRGVAYGPFRPEPDGSQYHTPERVAQDMAQMASRGINAIRTYTAPPRWFLDLARRHALRVLIGLPWEQHLAFLDQRRGRRDIERRVREAVRQCAGHPAVLAYAIGNEIPASIVRWYGRRRIERFIRRLYDAAKAEDPAGLVTYVNYPTTEYLHLPFIDFVCFNVYLEAPASYEAYLARLQNLAGDRPLVMTEIGLDSRRHGEDAQERSLDWQIRTAFASGCAGVFVFAWTDEWHRGGYDIEDWAFGLTRRDRTPKPSLDAVQRAFAEVPFPPDLPWPRISVVVCSYNGGRTIHDCCEGLLELQYPDVEVIVVNDGSRDGTAAIAQEFGFRMISTENRGLSSARNTGLEAATGEIVAYLDDDARPDPHWLTYLAAAFLGTTHAGIGGPNIPPPGDGRVADCVANAPGGPVHVLLSDREAEHIPGCNMAFRKSALQAVGGFDPQFRTAGDDVDICWMLQERGLTLGFSPAAMVWHHRRNSVRAYWRQQKGYGKAEALLERKWPQKYNLIGHHSWAGRIYGKGMTRLLGRHWSRVYHGVWGIAPFQRLYQSQPPALGSLPLMPEWYLLMAALAGFAALGALWKPLLIALPMLALAIGATLLQTILSALPATFAVPPQSLKGKLARCSLTAFLHLLQPYARLYGRVRHGLTPWRSRGTAGLALPWMRRHRLWSDAWQSVEERLTRLEADLHRQAVAVVRGGEYDRWDIEVRGGMLAGVRLRLAVEEHGAGKQLVHIRTWPRVAIPGVALTGLLGLLALGAASNGALVAYSILAVIALKLLLRTVVECGLVTAAILQVLRNSDQGASL